MSATPRKNISRSSIAEYWAAWERENGKQAPWSSHGWDWGEPACMAGGHWKPGWDNPKTVKVRWNETSLEKCHIVPLYLGGADEVSNMVLMCSSCHSEHPDSTDPEVTFGYMRARTLFDCLGVGGTLAKGLIGLASGRDADEVVAEALASVQALHGAGTL